MNEDSKQPYVLRKRYDFVSLAAISDHPVQPEDVIWADMLFRKATTLLAGQSGIGKTTFARGVAYAVASGNDYCGFSGPPGGVGVLYLDYETAGGFRMPRWRRVCGDDLSGMGKLFINDWHDPFDAISLVEEAKQADAGLVIVDTLLRATRPDNENDNSEMTLIMDSFDYLAREANCAVLVITHQAKGREQGFRGASAIGASAAVVVSFAREKNDQQANASNGLAFALTIEKNRYGGDDPIRLLRDGDGGYQLAPNDDGGVERGAAESAILAVLGEAGGLMQRKDVVAQASAKLAFERDRAPGGRTIERALDNLFDRGRVRRAGRGLYELPRQAAAK